MDPRMQKQMMMSQQLRGGFGPAHQGGRTLPFGGNIDERKNKDNDALSVAKRTANSLLNPKEHLNNIGGMLGGLF